MNVRTKMLASAAAGSAAALGVPLYRGMPVPVFDVEGGAGGGNQSPVDLKTLAGEVKQIAVDLRKSNDETKKIAEQALAESKNLGSVTTETKTKFDGEFTKLNTLKADFDALVQKFDRFENGDHGGSSAGKSIGDLVTESETFKKAGVSASWRGKLAVKLNVKDITSATSTVGSETSPSNSLIVSDRQPGIVAPPERQLTIRDLLAPGQTSSSSIEYAQETGFTNNARVVSEGARKPQSDITFELRTAPVRTIAHIFKASRNIMDDVPALRSYIDSRARYGLRYAEEAEILAGDGTGQHLSGLITEATAYSAAFNPPGTLDTSIDTIRLAMLQVMLAEFPPTGIVLNPVDWTYISLLKDTMGRYLIGAPQDMASPRLWNLPVVETQALAVDTFLVGNFRVAAQIFDRMDVEVLLSTENEDDFVKNMVTIRAEERLALAVYRPEAFVHGDFGRVT